MNVADVGMIEGRRGFRFVDEAFFIFFIRSEVRREKLKRDEAVQLRVLGFIYHTHAPLA